MAIEHVGVTEGIGKDIAVDTVGGLEYQLVKMVGGADGVARLVNVDEVTSALIMIGYMHHEIHDGTAFMVSAGDNDIDLGEELSFSFTTPNTAARVHMHIFAACSLSATLEVCEGATVTVDSGSEVAPVNRDRNSGTASVLYSIETVPVVDYVSLGATITDDGTIIMTDSLGAGKTSDANVGIGDGNEFILKQATTYAIKLTALVDNGIASLALYWYEKAA